MKRVVDYLLITLFTFSAYIASPALAQSETPPAGPVGEVRGTIINRNSGKLVAESLEVMLHVLDQDFVDLDMKHAQSRPDGTFIFADIPFGDNLQFTVMAIYEGVTYSSDPAPTDMKSMQVAVDVPVYESTNDLASVQIDQMHVLFDFAADGLETREIYVISSASERTVKDVYELEADRAATLKFPLPEDADFIFFKPDDQDRFVKFKGGFADTYPILPVTGSSQLMVSYVVPYDGEREYTYIAPLNVGRLNFFLPEQANVSLQGAGLTGPESMTFENGESYKMYSYSGLNAGQTVTISIGGKVATASSKSSNTRNSTAVVIAFLGFAIMGLGAWWWRKSGNTQNDDNDIHSNEATLEGLIIEIAKLDEEYERGSLSAEAHHHLRQNLMGKAKRLL
ncbi:MAG TPA: hypothetical protein VFR47_18305 [Anaerolineales bacterium]|nr:hypothetical protein [Anaerolineales bacterium]